ncbi:MAG: bifunctional ornithine acetyltransferase/N-acetylglutamate synthase [Clostridiales bacterium]|nr:bifunctional ornithine acetyltransferase/N-acetylglutamate synthase [Clostridiales bacterium]
MKIIKGNVTTPKGFKAVGNFVGLKKEKKDLTLILSENLCTAAGCFTQNIVKAAPVLWDIERVKTKENKIKGIVVNSGNANACTGITGLRDAEATAEVFAELAGCDKENVLVCSTGVIGVNLPMEKLLNGIKTTYPLLSNSFESGESAAEAIMTTDTFIKTICVEIELSGKKVTIGGMAKGSGMINPNMATMLCFITTDADISKKMLDKALSECVKDTFNMICVDGDTSTNDTVLILASGLAENDPITEENADYDTFKEALFEINKNLAVNCVKDGEGATKLMEVTASGIKTKDDARKLVNSVVSSNLFKAALFGADANWGRVLCAMGYSGAKFDPNLVTIVFRSKAGEILLMDKGSPIVFDENKAADILKESDIYIDINLKEGTETATAWGCDLTYDYVKINGDYRS